MTLSQIASKYSGIPLSYIPSSISIFYSCDFLFFFADPESFFYTDYKSQKSGILRGGMIE
jgi:hypothetical protein